MFQNQIFQVKCFNLEIFEIFQTCPVQLYDYWQCFSTVLPSTARGRRVGVIAAITHQICRDGRRRGRRHGRRRGRRRGQL